MLIQIEWIILVILVGVALFASFVYEVFAKSVWKHKAITATEELNEIKFKDHTTSIIKAEVDKLYDKMLGNGNSRTDISKEKFNEFITDAEQRLSPPLMEVFKLYLFAGDSNKTIAGKLFKAESSVRNDVSKILNKYDVENKSQLFHLMLKKVDLVS